MTSKDFGVITFFLVLLISGVSVQTDSLMIWIAQCFMFAGGVYMFSELCSMVKRFKNYVMTDHGKYED